MSHFWAGYRTFATLAFTAWLLSIPLFGPITAIKLTWWIYETGRASIESWWDIDADFDRQDLPPALIRPNAWPDHRPQPVVPEPPRYVMKPPEPGDRVIGVPGARY